MAAETARTQQECRESFDALMRMTVANRRTVVGTLGTRQLKRLGAYVKLQGMRGLEALFDEAGGPG